MQRAGRRRRDAPSWPSAASLGATVHAMGAHAAPGRPAAGRGSDVSDAASDPEPHATLRGAVEDPRLTPARKTVYATGDFTVNAVLTSLSMIYATYFLIQVAGLRP